MGLQRRTRGDQVTDLREKAIQNPLEAGAILSPLDINRCPVAVTDRCLQAPREQTDDTQGPDLRSLPPYRPSNEQISTVVQSLDAPQNVLFRLIRLAHGGVDTPSQEWQAEVLYRNGNFGRVLLKFIVDELRHPGPLVGVAQQSASERETIELRAYARLQRLQGRHISHCYGAFTFLMPWGNTVVGVVLEDLSEQTETLHAFVRREGDKLKTASDIDPLARACFDLVHRCQEAGFTNLRLGEENVRVLHSSTRRAPHLMLADLSAGSTTEDFQAFWNGDGGSELGDPWQMSDEQFMFRTLMCLAARAAEAWMDHVQEHDASFLFWTEYEAQPDPGDVEPDV